MYNEQQIKTKIYISIFFALLFRLKDYEVSKKTAGNVARYVLELYNFDGAVQGTKNFFQCLRLDCMLNHWCRISCTFLPETKKPSDKNLKFFIFFMKMVQHLVEFEVCLTYETVTLSKTFEGV